MEKLKLCRLCLAQPLLSYSLLELNRAHILETLTSIKVNKEDNLPTRCCLKCWLNLKLAFQIQQNILESEKRLRLLDFEEETEEADDVTDLVPVPRTDLDIKQEIFEIVHKAEQDVDSETEEIEYGSIKVENLTDDNLLIICPTHGNKENCTSVQNEDGIQEKASSSPCHICGITIEDKSLIEHLKTHYLSRLKCDDCSTYCENIASYRTHIMSKHQDMRTSWVCSTCSSTFLYKPLYKIHIEKAHLNDNPQIKQGKKPLNRVLFEDFDFKYDCPYCNRKFRSEAKSLSHIKTHNKKECPVCGVKITPANFKVHVDSHSSKPVVCHLCGIIYKNPTSLRSHIYYTHSTRKYVCKYCKKVFKKGYDLPLHIKKEHTGQRDHVCDICGKSFFAFHNLNKHKKMTHMKLRPFECQYCQKTFSSKHSLRTHERQHTNITPYTCDVCGEGFRQNVSLKAHRKSKHNIVEAKTCACKVCGKKFGSRWAVLSHMRIH